MSAFVECAGCGELFPVRDPKGRGPSPKWCSGRCRKRNYGDPCVDCGARTRYGAERPRIPEPRCDSCARRRRTAQRQQIEDAIFWLRADGLRNPEIAERLGLSVSSVADYVCRIRQRGIDVAPVRLGRPPKAMVSS